MLRFILTLIIVCFCQIGTTGAQEDASPPWNQTKESSKLVAEQTPATIGVSTFLLPAPEIGVLEEKVVVVRGLTFLEASKRARNTLAFEWHTAADWKLAEGAKGSCGLWGAGGKSCSGGCMCGSGNHCKGKGFQEQ